MEPEALSIRPARGEDASVLGAAERAIASTPGRLASLPHEIHDETVEQKILELKNGSYLAAERLSVIVGHAFLEPLTLAVTSHVVVRLTIASSSVHTGPTHSAM